MHTISTFKFKVIIPKGLKFPRYTGRIIQGAFLQYLRKQDPIVSQELHEGNDRRTYTTKGIHYKKIGETTFGLFEIHTIDPQIIDTMISILTSSNAGEIYLLNRFCAVVNVEYEKHQFGMLSTYPLYSSIEIKFITPTMFANDYRINKMDHYPDLQRIFENMIKTYEFLFSPIENNEDLLIRLQRQLTPNIFEFQSKFIRLGENIKLKGFTGKISFIIEDSTGLDILKDLLEISNLWGIGAKRSMGMGRINVRYFPPKSKPLMRQIEED